MMMIHTKGVTEMGLRTVSGKKVPANYGTDRQTNVRNPLLLVYEKGRAQMSVRCGDLVAVTGARDPGIIEKVKKFAAGLPDDEPWTKEQVADLCAQVGRMPFPKLIRVEHLEGQGTLLIQVAGQKGPGVTELNYAKRSNRPTFNILPVLKDESIEVPKGMCLELPVALVADEDGLKVEVRLLSSVERAVQQRGDADGEEPDEAGDEANGG
jgi:hypothetical protein